MLDAENIREVIDALGGCRSAAADIEVNERTVRRWYSGARAPGREAHRTLYHALERRLQRIQTLMLLEFT